MAYLAPCLKGSNTRVTKGNKFRVLQCQKLELSTDPAIFACTQRHSPSCARGGRGTTGWPECIPHAAPRCCGPSSCCRPRVPLAVAAVAAPFMSGWMVRTAAPAAHLLRHHHPLRLLAAAAAAAGPLRPRSAVRRVLHQAGQPRHTMEGGNGTSSGG